MHRYGQRNTDGQRARHRRSFAALVAAHIVTQALVLETIFVTTGHAENPGTVSQKELQAKMAYCNTCHGPSGQGFRGFDPIPRLAGQPVQYLKNQLNAFSARGRSSNIMYNVSHVLSPAMLTALTTSFNELNPRPLAGAPKELAPEGKRIFDEGLPQASIPPCAS